MLRRADAAREFLVGRSFGGAVRPGHPAAAEWECPRIRLRSSAAVPDPPAATPEEIHVLPGNGTGEERDAVVGGIAWRAVLALAVQGGGYPPEVVSTDPAGHQGRLAITNRSPSIPRDRGASTGQGGGASSAVKSCVKIAEDRVIITNILRFSLLRQSQGYVRRVTLSSRKLARESGAHY